ncbi:MAG: hypothetical protein Kow0069_29050 [Promethearchaeota archaeon]
MGGSPALIEFFGTQLEECAQAYRFVVDRGFRNGRFVVTYSDHEVAPGALPEVYLAVVLPGIDAAQANALEQEYYDHLEELGDQGACQYGVTFWNE